MLINYLKLCFRILARNPFLTVVNITGLAVGLTVFFLLWQYAQNELRSNQQYKNWDRIVRYGILWHWTDDNQVWNHSSFAMNRPEETKLIARDFSEIESFTRVFKRENFTPEYQPDHGKDIYISFIDEYGKWRRFDEKKIVYADPNVFSFFGIPLISGSSSTCLSAGNSVVMSQSMAKKFFGLEKPIGKTIYIDSKIPFVVTGVFPDFSLHSSLDFDIAFSDVSLENSITKIVMSLGGCHSYFKLRPGVDIKSLEGKISRDGAKYYFMPISQKDEARIEFYLQPFHDVPFENHRWDYFKVKSRPLLYTLSAVAVIVLVMAWINYINLTLSAQGKRLKEIAVRKTIGSNTKQIIAQFVCESLVINLIAFFTALTLMQLIVIPVKIYLNFDIPRLRDASLSSSIFIFMTISIGILINGVVPVVITLRKNTRTIFQLSARKHTLGGFSNILSAMQFSVALVLIVWATTAFSQLSYILNKDLGIRKDDISVIELPREQDSVTPQKLRTISGECIRESLGEETTYYRTIVGDLDNFMICIRRSEAGNEVCIDSNGGVDDSFIPFFGIKLLAGRNFLPDRPADSTSIIVSQDALARLAIRQDEAVGMSIDVNSGGFIGTYKKATIIGIVSDYVQRPLLTGGDLGNHRGIILTYKNYLVPDNYPSKFAIRHRLVNNLPGLNKKIAGIYHREFPQDILKMYTLTEHINNHYADEAFARNQIAFFTILAILISSLGLLGTITNRVHEKKKEVGIRKILGAGTWHVAEILLKTTLMQMFIAVLIAFPIASYLVKIYIQRFSAQIDLTVYHYIFPLMLMFVILVVTTGSMLWRTLKSNPVDALRYE